MTGERTGIRHLSIQAKLNLGLVGVFTLVMVAIVNYNAWSERRLVLDMVERQTHDAADSYFDGINTMMLTGTLANRNLLRDKVLARPGVVEARLIRGEAITRAFGPGGPEQQPADDLDRRALSGELVSVVRDVGAGRVLTVVEPIRASRDYRGTDCLSCHAVPENSVTGAVRVSYSIERLDAYIDRGLLTLVGVQFGAFALGLVLMIYLLKRLAVGRINHLRAVMEAMARDSDLARTVDCRHPNDEIGRLAGAFNRMTGSFRDGLRQVADSTRRLVQVAERISAVADETLAGVVRQRGETDRIAAAINQMSTNVHGVAGHAARAMGASRTANDEATAGSAVAAEALALIEALVAEVERAAVAIQQLDAESEAIGAVLDVIRAVTEQTNMLALNAAIEAARAGDQGRGFAVVADEVRTLALRTRKSTDEIRTLIERLQGGARNAVRVMDAARGRAREGGAAVERSAAGLATIVGEVRTISQMNIHIAGASEQQSAVAEEIDRNIVRISDVADQTSEGAKQTAQVSEELARLARQLEGLVGRFRI